MPWSGVCFYQRVYVDFPGTYFAGSMKVAYSIRKATPADAETLSRLIRALADYERLTHEALPDPRALASHLDPDACPRVEALVAELADGNVVGFALFFPNYSTFLTRFGLYLEDLFVEPAYRGKGIGFSLFHEVTRIAYERGCERLEWQVLRWNTPAIAFYEKLGARKMDDWMTMRLTRKDMQTLLQGTSS